MTAVNIKSNNDTTLQSPTQIANQSFDQAYQVNVVEPLVINPITNTLDRMVQPGQTLPTSGLNPSTALSYDVNGDLQYIDETIAGTTYRTTLTYVARVLSAISSAVEL
jgi:hypothetical protein